MSTTFDARIEHNVDAHKEFRRLALRWVAPRTSDRHSTSGVKTFRVHDPFAEYLGRRLSRLIESGEISRRTAGHVRATRSDP